MELALGLAFPDLDSEAAKTTQIWRIAYGFQLIPGVISLLLWLCIHTYETPQFIVDKGRNEEAMRYLKKIYKLKHPHGYQALLQELEEVTKATNDQNADEVQVDNGDKERQVPGMWKVMTDPYYRFATWMVVGLCGANTLTGINAINFFSTRILSDIKADNPDHGLTPVQGDALLGGIQWIACFIAPFLTYFSMRAGLIGGFIAMGVFEILVGVFATL